MLLGSFRDSLTVSGILVSINLSTNSPAPSTPWSRKIAPKSASTVFASRLVFVLPPPCSSPRDRYKDSPRFKFRAVWAREVVLTSFERRAVKCPSSWPGK